MSQDGKISTRKNPSMSVSHIPQWDCKANVVGMPFPSIIFEGSLLLCRNASCHKQLQLHQGENPSISYPYNMMEKGTDLEDAPSVSQTN